MVQNLAKLSLKWVKLGLSENWPESHATRMQCMVSIFLIGFLYHSEKINGVAVSATGISTVRNMEDRSHFDLFIENGK
jgi:hypothetical protein